MIPGTALLSVLEWLRSCFKR